ncbi:microcystin-dependent protein [Clostridium saccharoperbutylacetonicum]|uniref:Phage tail collar domain-containing protein n=2 Tax=Clostridium TaxID=1485 RepID=M1M1X5_9CLOT|nr:phage tail protein [Clostridium saccharoperbutylacetonicum]AGF59625.1 phage tail collar domain-containing protein [Clostridium saccharoperbutylacetonicum N1-4(HMT)]NRT64518.1 microcystin-dependent protein [Clostridium saccharoperbutylacetonicum]NSB28993.1 microcystin-dependent protein [Clostridium saccharoperbutylacetonicum]NSB46207.1 microcystin-dependent protein [Clostridium saccharoperbutylacetonicum]
MNRIDINTNITNVVKKYLTNFSKSLVSRFYNKAEIDKKMANIDTRSIIGEDLDYIYCKLSADASFTVGQNIPFVQAGDAKGLSIKNGIVTLKKGKTYSLKYSLHESSGAWKFFYDITNSKEVATGARGDSVWNTTCTAVIHCDTDMQIAARVDRTTNSSSAVGIGAFLEVIEIGRTVLIDPAQQIDKESGIQDTPVGHIMSVMGLKAPPHYLACDGSVYNIVDYQKLANYFLNEFGSINYFGGDGVTTLAVPDMRELVPVGAEQNTTKTIASHDVYTAGQFKDDQMQKVTGSYVGILKSDGSASGAVTKKNTGTYTWGSGGFGSSGGGFDLDSSLVTRTDTTNTTHGKQIGVLFCIKFEPTYFMNYSPQYAGFDTKTLFEGTANSVGDYVLSDYINNYQFLYVYGDINNGLDKSMTVIDVSEISPTETLSYFQYVNGYYNIRFTIGEKKLTYIDSTIGSAWTSYNARISKIVGVKSGSMNVEAFNITDAEADNGVAEIWNEVGM